MIDQPETLAAIIADYRADIPAMTSGELPHPTPEYLRILLDRIEAAYKREHAEWHSETDAAKEARNRIACKMRYEFAAKCRACKATPGNAAAMRDLLEKIRHEYGWGLIGCRTCVSSETDVERVSDLFEKQIDAALSAPARNCDRFKTLDEAREAFQNLRGHKILADVELWDSMDEACALVRWLFAPAKGGGHA